MERRKCVKWCSRCEESLRSEYFTQSHTDEMIEEEEKERRKKRRLSENKRWGDKERKEETRKETREGNRNWRECWCNGKQRVNEVLLPLTVSASLTSHESLMKQFNRNLNKDDDDDEEVPVVTSRKKHPDIFIMILPQLVYLCPQITRKQMWCIRGLTVM